MPYVQDHDRAVLVDGSSMRNQPEINAHLGARAMNTYPVTHLHPPPGASQVQTQEIPKTNLQANQQDGTNQISQKSPISQESYPQGSYPQGSYPQGTYPQGPYPQGAYPQGIYPEGIYPAAVFSPENPSSPPPYKLDDVASPNVTCGEDGQSPIFDFTEKTVRRAFIRKVYGILTSQLLVTISFIALFAFHEPTRKWARENLLVFLIAIIVYFVMVLTMICCGELRRKAPGNFIFLGIFTLATGYMLGVVTSTYDADQVFIAVGVTAAVVFALTLFALQTKYDFTTMGGCLLCALVILILFGILSACIPNRIIDFLYASAGALIFSLYIVYDTQLMLGGEHKYSISPEEYIFAALNLYLDIINLFLKILYLIARR